MLFSILKWEEVSGQLCTGSLGDPVVNITFGQGTNPGQALSSSVTNYGFVNHSCPNDGFYSIGNSTANCFNDSWHTVSQDHTPGDENGYMMIVNASNNPGVFYVDTARGLCANTTYEFAAWILNVIKNSSCSFNTIKPNVTFNIETVTGAVLLTYTTGDIEAAGSPLWKQYGAFFSTPAGISTVVIRMTNNATGGCGNDILLDDITFKPCGAKVTATTSDALPGKDLCVGDNSIITLTGSASQADSNTYYQWQTSSNNGQSWMDIAGANTTTYVRPANAATAANYLYRLAVAQGTNISLAGCRIASEVITIGINAYPKPAANNDGPKCVGDTLTLSAGDGQQLVWTGPNGFTSNQQHALLAPLTTNDAGKYLVTVTSAKGCTSFDSTIVEVKEKVLVSAGPDQRVCRGNSAMLQGSGSGFSFSWSPANGLSATNISTPDARPDTTTRYILAVSNGACTAYDTATVTVYQLPFVNAGTDLKIFQGQTGLLNGMAGGDNIIYFWTPPVYINNPSVLIPVVNPPSDTTYTLHAVSNNGCGSATDQVFVRVYKAIKAPNVFSPNGDGINDTWYIEALDTYPEASLSVFNRYGQLVYSASGDAPSWNGTYNNNALPAGVYYYLIDLKNGTGLKSGSVTILK